MKRVSTKLARIISRFIEASPLAIFLIYAQNIDRSAPENWLEPYMVSGIASILSMGLLTRLTRKFNPIFIGINLYLISGAVALLAGITWLNKLYGLMQASGMLVWVTLVGFYCLVVSSRSTPAIKNSGKHQCVYSAPLLATSITACVLAYVCQPNKLLSEYAPFILLFTVQALLEFKHKIVHRE